MINHRPINIVCYDSAGSEGAAPQDGPMGVRIMSAALRIYRIRLLRTFLFAQEGWVSRDAMVYVLFTLELLGFSLLFWTFCVKSSNVI